MLSRRGLREIAEPLARHSPARHLEPYHITRGYGAAIGTALVLTLPLPLLPAGPVSAADLGPSSRLMLAAIVAQYSPELADAAKDELSRLAAGDLSRADAAQKMEVSANSIECRASDVDITSRSCAITYGSKSVTLSGRSAHELFATIGEVGVPAGGYAGTYTIGLSALSCTVSPPEISARSGGGVQCTFTPAAP